MPRCDRCGKVKEYINLGALKGRKVLVQCGTHRADYSIYDIPIHIPERQIERYLDAKM